MDNLVDRPGHTTVQECKDLEAYETDEWAAKAILEAEALWGRVLDPCAGFGMLGKALEESHQPRGLFEYDVKPWWEIRSRNGYVFKEVTDFLQTVCLPWTVQTVFMNPPFSLATDFVEHARMIGAKKIICFQRHSWWESQGRAEFWARNPPNRIYSCRKRATCLRFDIITGDAPMPNGSSTTAHSWFIWEEGHPPGTLMGHV